MLTNFDPFQRLSVVDVHPLFFSLCFYYLLVHLKNAYCSVCFALNFHSRPHVGGIWMDSANGIILDMKNTYGSVCFALNFMQTYMPR